MKHYVYSIPKIRKVGATQNPQHRIEVVQGFKNWKKYIIGEFNSAVSADIFEKNEQFNRFGYTDTDYYPDMLGPIKIKHLGKATCTLKGVHYDDVDEYLEGRGVVITGKNCQDMIFETSADISWLRIHKQRGFKSGEKEAYWRLEPMLNYYNSAKRAAMPKPYATPPKKVHMTDAYTAAGANLFTTTSTHDEFVHPKDYSFEAIRVWCQEKKLYGHKNSSINTQALKLGEEFGELQKAILKDEPEKIKDAIGDLVVVLTSISELNGHSIETAIQHAWKQIRVRKGPTNAKGDFIKKHQGPKY